MKILPPVTEPWRQAINRRHTPKSSRGARGYRSYRPCLRWEFGFSCAFCLCHEVDLAPYLIEGSGLTHGEHFIPKSRDESRRNTYKNLFYVCRFCNVSRHIALNEGSDGQLVDPCERAWHEVFILSRDMIRPRDKKDLDATYTLKTYKLNDAPKVRMRRLRRHAIRKRLRSLEETRTSERDLLDLAEAAGKVGPAEIAKTIWNLRWHAYMDLCRFRAIPGDRDASCRCHTTTHHTLPRVLEKQTIDISDLRPARRGTPPLNGSVGDSTPN